MLISLDETLRTETPRHRRENVAEREEIDALRQALRESRHRLHRSALESTQRIVALSNDVARLEAENRHCQQRIKALEAGALSCETGRLLRRLDEDSDALRRAAHRLWTLEKTLTDAHLEYAQVAEERDRLALACLDLRAQLGQAS